MCNGWVQRHRLPPPYQGGRAALSLCRPCCVGAPVLILSSPIQAAAAVLGATLESVGDTDDTANVTQEVVLDPTGNGGSLRSHEPTSHASLQGFLGRRDADAGVTVLGRLLACDAILRTCWGEELAAAPDVGNAVVAECDILGWRFWREEEIRN
jgi:hypothetical protein